MNLRDWVELEWIRVWWPGIDPMENSHRRNMALFEAGNDRGKPDKGVLGQAEEAFKELNEMMAAGIMPE